MLKLGNIVLLEKEDFETEKIKSLKDNTTLFFYSDIEEIKDKSLPTLVIGWKLLKTKIKGISILNKKIKTNLFWTFSSKEKIQEFNENIDEFINKLSEDLIKGIKYKSIDPIVDKLDSEEDFKKILPHDLISYSNEELIYSFSEKDKTVFSIDLATIEFGGWSLPKIVEIIKSNSKIFHVETYTEESGIYLYRKFINIKEIDKFIPYIISKDI